MIADWNRNEVEKCQVVHFRNSLRPFVVVRDKEKNRLFLDLDTMEILSYEDLEYDGLRFYTLEEDEDFCGVQIDGRIEWVDD